MVNFGLLLGRKPKRRLFGEGEVTAARRLSDGSATSLGCVLLRFFERIVNVRKPGIPCKTIELAGRYAFDNLDSTSTDGRAQSTLNVDWKPSIRKRSTRT